jgi:hypothetical protein
MSVEVNEASHNQTRGIQHLSIVGQRPDYQQTDDSTVFNEEVLPAFTCCGSITYPLQQQRVLAHLGFPFLSSLTARPLLNNYRREKVNMRTATPLVTDRESKTGCAFRCTLLAIHRPGMHSIASFAARSNVEEFRPVNCVLPH